MNRLSIFSFKTFRAPLGGIALSLALFAFIFAALSFALGVADVAQTFGGWNNPFMEAKLHFANKIYKKHGRINVLHLSSSVGNQTRTEQWQEASGDNIICFNGSMGGQRPSLARFIFENIYYPRYQIQNVIYSLTPRDINGRGSVATEVKKQGFLWDSYQLRKHRKDLNFKERIVVNLEWLNYLFRARKHFHTFIAKGRPDEDVMYMLPTGTLPPSIFRMGDRPATEADRRRPGNPYANYSVSPAELNEIIELAEFCKSHGVRFAVVNQSVSPFAYESMANTATDYAKYEQALETMRGRGIEVYDMKKVQSLSNLDFSDADHSNIWGGNEITNYIYQNVIKKWFPEVPMVHEIPHPTEVHLADCLPLEHNFLVRSGHGAVPLQVVAKKGNHNPIIIREIIPGGKYHFSLYSSIESSSLTELEELEDIFTIALIDPQSSTVLETSNVDWKPTARNGNGISQTTINVPKAGAVLGIRLLKLKAPKIAMDSITLMQAVPPVSYGNPSLMPERIIPKGFPQLVRNGDFEYASAPDNPSPVAEWLLYTRDRPPWGTAKIVESIHPDDGNALELVCNPQIGWGSIVLQRYERQHIKTYVGQNIQVATEARTVDMTAIYATIIHAKEYSAEPQRITMVPAKAAEGHYKVMADIMVTSDTKYIELHLGSLNSTPVSFDQARIVPVY